MNILSKEDGNLIRATEVISSVAKCVRELLENSLDSNATIINVNLSENGLSEISVSDNGDGISKSDLELIAEEGFTSKDYGKSSLGGRGMALEAIRRISDLIIQSSTEDSGIGFQLSFSNQKRNLVPITRVKGTTVSVRNIFNDYPVRRFYSLEHQRQQSQDILGVVSAFAIIFNGKFLFENGKTHLSVSGKNQLQRIQSVLGSGKFLHKSVQLDNWFPETLAELYTSSPTNFLKEGIFLYVNERPCINGTLFRGIREEYKMCAGPKKPTVVIDLRTSRDHFDFLQSTNIISITFVQSGKLFLEILKELKNMWKSPAVVLEMTESNKELSQFLVNSSPKSQRINQTSTMTIQSKISTKSIVNQFNNIKDYSYDPGEKFDFVSISDFDKMDIIGQWNKSFILLRHGSSIYAIDQHAACEAINFESLRKKPIESKQKLIVPISLMASAEEVEVASQNLKQLNDLGFEFEIEGNTIVVTAVPSEKNVVCDPNDLHEILELLKNSAETNLMSSSSRRFLQFRACKSSIKAGDVLDLHQTKKLLKRMSTSDYPWNCPHGRPTWCSIWDLSE